MKGLLAWAAKLGSLNLKPEAHFLLLHTASEGWHIRASVMLSLPAGTLNSLCFAPTAPGTQPDLLLLLHAAHQSIGEWTEL